jgi:hypothetical protein
MADIDYDALADRITRSFANGGGAKDSTLQSILNATVKAHNLDARSIKDTEKSLDQTARTSSTASDSMRDLAISAGGAAAGTKSAFSEILKGFTGARAGVEDQSYELQDFGRNLRTTAADIAKSWTHAFNDTAMDPITRASDTFSRTISLAGQGIGLLGKNIDKVIPGQLGKGVSLFVQGATKLGTAGFQAANQILAQEMQSTVKAMATFNDMGASFGGGMMEMRTMALDSGLSLQQFGGIIKENREAVLGFGGTIADGSLKVSRTMEQLSANTGKSGQSLSAELLNMGISLEEQGKIAISYMANQRSLTSTTEIRGRSEKDIALKTRQYAEDLKILSEFTGKDAKAVAERARQESMRAAIMSSLTTEQREGLQAGLRGMETVPEAIRDNFKTALMQQLSGGAITDPLIAGNEEYMKYVKEAAARIQQGGENIQTDQMRSTARLAKTVAEQNKLGDGIGTAVDKARLFGANLGEAGKQADAANALGALANDITEEGIIKSKKSIDESASNTEKTQKAFTDMQLSAADFNKSLGHIATNLLPTYSSLLKGTNEIMTSAMGSLQQVVTGNMKLSSMLSDGMTRFLRENFGSKPAAGEPNRNAAERRARGGPVLPNSPYLIGENGPELFVPDVPGAVVANAMVSSMQASQQKAMASNKQPDVLEALPTLVSDALNTVFEGPNGFASVMNSVKNQLSENNDKQLGVMAEQISKLNDLVTAMQDNVRASENIANVLG